jgi:hypothetical protein
MVFHAELMRKVLLEVEELPNGGRTHDISVEGYTDSEVSYHIELLHEAGYLVGKDVGSQSGKWWRAKRLTFDGHQFLNSIRDDGFFERLQIMVKENTGGVSVEALRIAAPILLQRLLGGS